MNRTSGPPAKGFTIVELMVVVAVMGILLAVAIPSFVGITRNNRATSEANEFLTLLMMARSEAVKRNRTVRMCKSPDGAACSTSASWAEGVLVFVDLNADGVLDGGEPVVRAQAPFSTGSTIDGGGNFPNFIAYRPSGVSNNNGTFTIVPSGGTEYGRAVVVSNTGRPRVSCATGATKCI